ncbi:MAG: calcineurin-like phosphoesterase family protein [Phycisphaerales bacterium]
MKKENIIVNVACALFFIHSSIAAAISGFVYEDKNKNNIKDKNEKPIANIAVSNGRDVVLTDKKGQYHLDVNDSRTVFVIKPAGWNTRTDTLNIPRFYYNLIDVQFSTSMDFALYKNSESDNFDIILYGDPQLKSKEEIGFFCHDAIEETIGVKGEFGVILGDIAFDNQNLYNEIDKAVALTGINFYRVPGNHDMDYNAKDDDDALENYRKLYGPPYYSFNYGNVHFIMLDNIISKRVDDSYLRYDEGISDRILEFIKNDLAFVSKDKQVVLMGHANITEFDHNKNELLDMLAEYPHTLSIAGHDHRIKNIFIDSNDGWDGKKPHHIYVAGAVCGAWWQGFPNEDGIPNAMMTDGTPNGYSIVSFKKHEYSIRYKAFGKDEDFQMIAYLPDEMTSQQAAESEVILNIFAGTEKDIVEMSIDSNKDWKFMQYEPKEAPFRNIALDKEAEYNFPRYDWAKSKSITGHIWTSKLPTDLSEGTHIIFFRSVDMYGNKHFAKRIIRIQ